MILVVQGQLPHYRLEVFNALCSIDEITVAHSGNSARRQQDRFAEVILPAYKVGPFRYQYGLWSLIQRLSPEVIIAMFDIRWLNSVMAMYRYDSHIPWVWWGLDYGKSRFALLAKLAIAQRSNPIIFYSKSIREQFCNHIRGSERLFTANNTFHVPQRVKGYLSKVKNRFINVGSLDSRKQNEVTIKALANIIRDTQSDIRLTLIGDGPERKNLKSLACSLDIEDRVEMPGEVNDPDLLSRYYAESYASISFGQAGLAVLQSMAFGVPFITKRNAISGGEKFNILDGSNGYLCEDDRSSLESIMRTLIAQPELAQSLGKGAYDHYSNEASIEDMVVNFQRAIVFAREANASRFR